MKCLRELGNRSSTLVGVWVGRPGLPRNLAGLLAQSFDEHIAFIE